MPSVSTNETMDRISVVMLGYRSAADDLAESPIGERLELSEYTLMLISEVVDAWNKTKAVYPRAKGQI